MLDVALWTMRLPKVFGSKNVDFWLDTMPRAVANPLSSLHQAWDDDDVVRRCVRDFHVILDGGRPTFHPTVKSCGSNWQAILPVLELTKKPLDMIYS